MSATKLGLVAAAIKTRLETVTGLKVYAYEPRDIELTGGVAGLTGACCATISGPSTIRTQPEEVESQLGANDWSMTWTVRLYVYMDDPETAQVDARRLLGSVIAAVDADRSLGGEALDASVVSAELGFTEDESGRQMAVYECEAAVWSLV